MPTVSYLNQTEIIDYFVDILEQRLAGRHKRRIVNRIPIDECYLGVLAPYRQEVEEVDPSETGEESTEDSASPQEDGLEKDVTIPQDQPGSISGEDSPEADLGGKATPEGHEDRDFVRRPPSSLGIEFLIGSEEGEIYLETDVDFSVYTPHLPNIEEQRKSLGGTGEVHVVDGKMTIGDVWERRNIVVFNIGLRLPVEQPRRIDDSGIIQTELDNVIDAALSASDARPKFEIQPKMDGTILGDEKSYVAWLEEIRRGLSLLRPPLRAALDVRSCPVTDGKVRVSVYLRNNTLKGVTRTEDNYHILVDAKIKVRILKGTLRAMEILPVPEDYQYDRRVWAVGHNASVEIDYTSKTLETRTLARFRQSRLVAKNDPPARFRDLVEEPFVVLEQIYKAMEEYARRWQKEVIGQNSLGLDELSLAECEKDWKVFKEEIDRFCKGVASLIADRNLLDAFRGMNRVMGRFAQGYDSWRLFQIVFIVCQLPAIALRGGTTGGSWPGGVKRDWKDEFDWADVLWFPTGSGKTEAYLGLISCAILYDRLRGKNLGLTAWLRFPLRMLSVQQLQRAMGIIWETERERKNLLGTEAEKSDPVCLGYFVGSSTTPNRLDEKFFLRCSDAASCEKFRVIADCPACKAENSVQIIPDPKNFRLRFICDNCKVMLPLFVTDSEIYRFLPSLIVGTVDKMATVGLQQRFGILWAGPRWICPEHGYSYADYCEVYGCTVSKGKRARRKVEPYDSSPTLHIQDELHLLQEELGAFAGHYETLTRFCENSAGHKPAKVIAATATIEGYEHQARHLYGVIGARRFPARGYERHESFYTMVERDLQNPNFPKTARVFVALRPPSGNAADVAAKCTQILHQTISSIINNPYEGLAAMPSLANETNLMDLLCYYSTTLTYVNSLDNGTRVKDLLQSAAQEMHWGQRELKVEYLSSRSSTGEVSEVIHRMENPPPWEDSNFLDAIVATNMISHGVDLDRINLMVMDKFPAETAEYIQASSRSGRKKIGLIIVVLPSYNLRAASIYHRFNEYHKHLDRMVSPVPVNRFAKYAVYRTLPGIISGLIYGLVCPERNSFDLGKRRLALDWIKNNLVRVENLIKSAYALDRGFYERDLEEFHIMAIRDRLGDLLPILTASMEEKLTEALRPKPMTSLRDVDRAIPFRMMSTDPLFHSWFLKDME